MIYEHHCRACDLDWLEEYKLSDAPPDTCPECKSSDVFRCVSDSGVVVFKGAGWSFDGYYKNKPLDAHKGRIKLYDRKEDYLREHKGEAAEYMRRRLMRQNESIKRTLGYDLQIKEKEAAKKIKKFKDKAGSDI